MTKQEFKEEIYNSEFTNEDFAKAANGLLKKLQLKAVYAASIKGLAKAEVYKLRNREFVILIFTSYGNDYFYAESLKEAKTIASDQIELAA